MIGRVSGRLDYRASDHVLIDVNGIGYLVYCSEKTLSHLPPVGEYVALYTDLLVREDNLQLLGFHSLIEKEWHRLLVTVQGVGAKAALAIQGSLGAEGVNRAISLDDWQSIATAKGIGPKIAQRVVAELKDKAPSVMLMGAHTAHLQSGPQTGSPPTSPTGSSASADGDVIDYEGARTHAQTDAQSAPADIGGGLSGDSRTHHDPFYEDPNITRHWGDLQSQALSALVNLGYASTEAARAVMQARTNLSSQYLQDHPSAQTSQPLQGALPQVQLADFIRAALKLLAPKE